MSYGHLDRNWFEICFFVIYVERIHLSNIKWISWTTFKLTRTIHKHVFLFFSFFCNFPTLDPHLVFSRLLSVVFSKVSSWPSSNLALFRWILWIASKMIFEMESLRTLFQNPFILPQLYLGIIFVPLWCWCWPHNINYMIQKFIICLSFPRIEGGLCLILVISNSAWLGMYVIRHMINIELTKMFKRK